MRKIGTKVIDEKHKKRNLIVGIALVVLMLVSTIGYSLIRGFGNDDSDGFVTYGEFKFASGVSGWELELEGQRFYFQNLPQDVLDVNIEGLYSLGDYSGSVLYFVNLNEQAREILVNLERYVGRWQEACLEECEKDVPIKTCEDNVIVFVNMNESQTGNLSIIQNESILDEARVYKDNKCVYISGGSSEEIVRASDGFLYRLLGII